MLMASLWLGFTVVLGVLTSHYVGLSIAHFVDNPEVPPESKYFRPGWAFLRRITGRTMTAQTRRRLDIVIQETAVYDMIAESWERTYGSK